MEVIYIDNHILIVNKPAGISTQTPGLEDMAKKWIKEKFKKPGKVFLEPVHRLDKVVRGLVLFARTSKALSRLQAEMRIQGIEKRYRAQVEGIPNKEEALLEHYLEHGDFKAYLSPKGKKAVLHYKLLKKEKGQAILEIDLKTGRYHQIRIQLATIGHPIIGDDKYGSHTAFLGAGIALEHVRMSFTHPITKERLVFTI